MLATLVRTTGSLEIAEDAVQDAALRALAVWPRDGVPPQPRAWLTLAARNRAIDLLRREAVRASKETTAMQMQCAPPAGSDADAEVLDDVLDDDLLRLLFTCCHPSLAVETQTALALRVLCGLSTAEVARALLVPEAAMAKRLTRARRKIAVTAIPYRTPSAEELPRRLPGVLTTVYLLFNEGYSASAGDDPIRSQLCDEAVRLARMLHGLLPAQPSVAGLLALLLLQDSRRDARVDDDREIVLLAEQDRARWNRAAIAEGMTLLGTALRRAPTQPDLYATQAAIAACHALAPSWDETNWPAILSWYDVLLSITDTPVVRLNRAVALAEVQGPGAGLRALDDIPAIPDYAALPAARAELCHRLGRYVEAAAAWRQALEVSGNSSQRAYFSRRLAELHRPPDPVRRSTQPAEQ